jgi:hypothetical protein
MKRLTPQQYASVVANLLNLLRHSLKDFTLDQLKLELQKKQCPYIPAIIPILTSRNFIVKSNKFYNFAIPNDFVAAYFTEEIESSQKAKHGFYKNKKTPTIETKPLERVNETIALGDKLPKEINITIGNITIIIKQ